MSVVIETTIGDITVDLYLKERPNTCLNFLKLCKIKYYNLCLFHKIERNFIAQTGDPTATGRGGESVYCRLYGDQAKYFDAELKPRLKHEKIGTLSMVNNGNNMNGSQFFLTLGENLTYLDEVHTVFGEVAEGFETLLKINEAICDPNNRPYQDIRITHTVVLHDPYDDPNGLEVPDASPEPTREQLESNYIGADEEIDDTKGKNMEEIEEKIKESEAKARATILEMVGDIPDVDVKPPENVLFVCKLNPVTTSEDLEVIFSRFGPIKSCEVIKDKKSGESLQYAFIEFENEEDCENAYFKMDNVLIDDRRIHVDFSQSVSKLQFDMEANSSKGKPSQSQNFMIKNTQKLSHGYDMIFDMDENSNEYQNHKKVHKQKPLSPEHKRKHTNKPHDSVFYRSHKADKRWSPEDEYRKSRRSDVSSPNRHSSRDKIKKSYKSVSEKNKMNIDKQTYSDQRKNRRKSSKKSRSPSASSECLRQSREKSRSKKSKKKRSKHSRSSSCQSNSSVHSYKHPSEKLNVKRTSPHSLSSSTHNSHSESKRRKTKHISDSRSTSSSPDRSTHNSYSKAKRQKAKHISVSRSSSPDHSVRNSLSKPKRGKIKHISDSRSASSSPVRSAHNSYSKSKRQETKHITDSRSSSPDRSTYNSHSKSKRKKTKHISDSRSASSSPDRTPKNKTIKHSHYKSAGDRRDKYHH